MTIERGYVTLTSGKQVHYRRSGKGPPLVMLHPSPQCSESLLPALKAFSSHCTCFALDTPGYGLSDDLDMDAPVIEDYVAPLQETLDLLGIDKACIYGSATGAQIAVAYSKTNPQQVLLLMLDTNGHVEAEEQTRILDGYLPSVEPQRSGGHLLTYWQMCQRLFMAFPWHSPLASDRLDVDVPPAIVLHQIFIRYLRAGESYVKAYRAAFNVESIDHVLDLKVPTTMLRWEGSIILKLADDMIALGLPENISVVYAGATLEDRYEAQVEVLKERYQNDDFIDKTELTYAKSDALERAYLSSNEAHLHVWQNTRGNERPVVVLHDAGQSGAQVTDLIEPFAGQRPVYAIDLPGHGESVDVPASRTVSVEALADPIAHAMQASNIVGADLVGIGLGGAIAMAISEGVQANQIVLIDPFQIRPNDTEMEAARSLADLTPRMNGTHILAAWSIVSHREQFAPWFDLSTHANLRHDANLEPNYLHAQTCDLLKLRCDYWELCRLTSDFEWLAEINSSDVSVTIARSPRQSDRSANEWSDTDAFPVLDLPNSRQKWLARVLEGA